MIDLVIKLLTLAAEAIGKIVKDPELYTSAEIDMAIEATEELQQLHEKLENARAERSAAGH